MAGVHLAKRRHAERADAIICPSYATQAHLRELWPDVASRSVVVPHGVSEFWQPSGRLSESSKPVILFVGRRDSYKRFPDALQALTRLPTVFSLLAVGGGPFRERELRGIDHLGLNGRVRQMDLTDESLRRAYRSAAATLVPSEIEGFGLVVLEAMAAGCPVVIASTPALTEVGGAAALAFSVGDYDGYAGAISQLHEDAGSRAQRVQAGLERSRQYSWRECAARTTSVYVEVM